MKRYVLIKRYCSGLLNTIKNEQEFFHVKNDLTEFHTLIASNPEISHILTSPFLPLKKRLAITQDVLDKILKSAPASNETPSSVISSRFIRLLVENGRLNLLEEILETLPRLWNDEHNIATFEISSAVPLSDHQKERLIQQLSCLEGRQVALTYHIDPGLIGGLSVKRDHIIYDASIAGSLERLKEKIKEG